MMTAFRFKLKGILNEAYESNFYISSITSIDDTFYRTHTPIKQLNFVKLKA
jgi:hypothetical protein